MTKKYIVGNVSHGEVLEKILAALEVSPFEEQELRSLFLGNETDLENQVSDLEDELDYERSTVEYYDAKIEEFSKEARGATSELEALKGIPHEDYYAKIDNLLALISRLEDQFN